MSARLIAIAIAVLVTAAPSMAQTPERPIGDIEVFATLPYPGHPGGLAVAGRTLYVDTSNADFDRPFDASDEIWAFNLDSGQPAGGLRSNPIEVAREASVQTMGLLGMDLDSQGRIYAADMNGRIVRVDPRTGAQQVYATIPTSTDTSFTDMPGFPVFGRDGKLYVALFAKNQLSILDSDGTEALRFPSPEENAEREIPVEGPFGLAFDGRGSLLAANTGDPTFGKGPGGIDPPGGLVTSDTWVVFDVFVDDTAAPLFRPVIP